MSLWRISLVSALCALPVAILVGLGGYYLWHEHLWFYAWWPMAASLGVGYYLAWRWQKGNRLLPFPDFTPPLASTDRDQKAWETVKAHAKAIEAQKLPPDKFLEPTFYVETGQELAKKLAHHYHPNAKDPVGGLTIPEILTVTELASRDLWLLVQRYVPASHLLTLDRMRLMARVPDYYSTASNVYWAGAALFNPVGTGMRYLASKMGITTPFKMLQDVMLLWLVQEYVDRVGFYLIELYSGRLKAGAERYRQITGQALPPPLAAEAGAPPAAAPAPVARPVTITLVGQAKVGKSSLINALLGERKAVTDVVPATSAVTRYDLKAPEGGGELVLLDTVGYGNEGPRGDNLRATLEAAQQSDLVLLVLHATRPGREPDLTQLEKLREWFRDRPNLKRPTILAVLTHIDLLSPMMEWSPPYDWRSGERPKERSIREALKVAQEHLGDRAQAVVPVCTKEGRRFGIDEALLPEVAQRLDEAKAVSLIRTLHTEGEVKSLRRVADQFWNAGKGLLELAWRQR